jgi:hypothetical protein
VLATLDFASILFFQSKIKNFGKTIYGNNLISKFSISVPIVNFDRKHRQRKTIKATKKRFA